MFLTRKSKRTEVLAKMLEVAEQQLSKWFENKAQQDILEGVISGISQHIEQSDGFKKRTSFHLRLDQHPPKWLKEIFIREHFDYSHILSTPKEIAIDFNELTVSSRALPENYVTIYDRVRQGSPA